MLWELACEVSRGHLPIPTRLFITQRLHCFLEPGIETRVPHSLEPFAM